MWRRVASQSPQAASGPKDAYVKAFSALGLMLRDGRSLSGNERNCCFLNTSDGRFAIASAASGLGFADDGRAIGLTDWDHDGDVDVWLANRTGPRLRFMRNEASQDASFVTVKLVGTKCNRDAIGARLELSLSAPSLPESPKRTEAKGPLQLIRSVHAGRGFMSQASKRIHFGVGTRSIRNLVVRWPNGEVEQFDSIRAGRHYEITQGAKVAKAWHRPRTSLALRPSIQAPVEPKSQSRIVVTGRLPMPAVNFRSIQSDAQPTEKSPTLINLWSASCLPCIDELSEFARRAADIRQAGIAVLALNVDERTPDADADLSSSRELLKKLEFPFAAAAIDSDTAGMLDLFHQAFLSLRRPLPVPSSFLVTPDGRVAVIYRGPTTVDQVVQDVQLLDLDPRSLRERAVPFSGRWHTKPFLVDPKRHATAFFRGGFVDQGAKYLENYLLVHLNQKGWGPRESWPSPKRLAELCDILANYYRLQDEPEKVAGVYRIALRFDPQFVPSLMNLGKIMVSQRKIDEGLSLLEQANRLAPDDPVIASDLAISYAIAGRTAQAEELLLNLLNRDADTFGIRLNLGRLYYQSRRFADAAVQLRGHLKDDPKSTDAIRMLCWILACSPVDADRSGADAEDLLQQLTDSDEPALHDLRAAVSAELGDFKSAVSSARRALELLSGRNAKQAREIQRRLDLYQQSRPYRLR